jgi:hypothetical protein
MQFGRFTPGHGIILYRLDVGPSENKRVNSDLFCRRVESFFKGVSVMKKCMVGLCLLVWAGIAGATEYTYTSSHSETLSQVDGVYSFTEEYDFTDENTLGDWASKTYHYNRAGQNPAYGSLSAISLPINWGDGGGVIIYHFIIPIDNAPVKLSALLRLGAGIRVAAELDGLDSAAALMGTGPNTQPVGWIFTECTRPIPTSQLKTSEPGYTSFYLQILNEGGYQPAAGIDRLVITSENTGEYTNSVFHSETLSLVDGTFTFIEDYTSTGDKSLGDWASKTYQYQRINQMDFGTEVISFPTVPPWMPGLAPALVTYRFIVPIDSSEITIVNFSALLREGAAIKVAATSGQLGSVGALLRGDHIAGWGFTECNGTIPVSQLDTTVPGQTSFSLQCYNEGNYQPAAGMDRLTITVPTTKMPIFSPAGQYFSSPKTITITSDIPGAVVRYTTDGTDPSQTNGTEIPAGGSGSVVVNNGTTLKARAWSADFGPSAIKTVTYTIPAVYNRPETIPQTNAMMTIDGSLTDWADVTWAPLDQRYDFSAADISNASYAAKWSSDGKVYMAIKVQETSVATYSFANDYAGWDGADQVEIYLHTTSGLVGGNVMLQEAAQQYILGIRADNYNQVWKRMVAGIQVPESVGFQAAGSADANGLIVYEVAMNAYEYFGGLANKPTIVSPLAVGDVIGLDVCLVGRNSSGYTGMKSENLLKRKYADWTKLGVHKLGSGRILGDANDDGMVDVGDLGILAANYGGLDKTWALGDFNNDGLVDVGDLGILAAHYGEGSTNAANFSEDYAKAFGTTVTDDAESDATNSNSVCGALGLPLIAGLLLMGMLLVKLEE